MERLNEGKLNTIIGGGLRYGVIYALVGFTTFMIGVIDGFLRPLPCR